MIQGRMFESETKEALKRLRIEVHDAKYIYKRFYPENYRELTRMFIIEYLNRVKS